MKNRIFTAVLVASVALELSVLASDEHSHTEANYEEHKDGDEHGNHHEEESSIVGAERGIVAASADSGIKLSPEASKNFDLQTAPLAGPGPWTLPVFSVVYSGREVNLYRFREGFYKRIDFKVLSKDSKNIRVMSPDLRSGDSIATGGLGFLRVAEIAAFGGAPEGHSH